MHARSIITAVAVITAQAALVAGLAACSTPGPATSPAPCKVAGRQLPSGDTIKVDSHGNGWTAGTTVQGAAEYVCTDGKWIHVTDYSN